MASGLKEVAFGENSKGEAKQYTDVESLGLILYNIFVMRPGSLPSLPHVGVDIRKYMYRLEGTINTDELRESIIISCNDLLEFIDIGDVNIQEVDYQNEKLLVIIININLDDESHVLISAFRTNENELLYSFRTETLNLAP